LQFLVAELPGELHAGFADHRTFRDQRLEALARTRIRILRRSWRSRRRSIMGFG
jgi:hypothetical protein